MWICARWISWPRHRCGPIAARLGSFTRFNNPALVSDVAGTGVPGVQFNGTSDAFTGPHSVGDIDGASTRSIEAWVFNPAITTEETLLEIGHRGTGGRNCAFNFGTSLTWGACAQAASSYDVGWNAAPNIPSAGAWHHFVYTYDGATTCYFYVDSVLRVTKTLPGALNIFAGEPILLGAQRDNTANNPPSLFWFSGYLNAVRVHGGVLTSNQVAANYVYGPALADGPVTLIAQPRDVAALEGGRAMFTAQPSGASPVRCQWFSNGVPLLAATQSTLVLTNVSWADHGASFHMLASNVISGSGHAVTSRVARLTVLAAGDALTHRWSFTSNANDSIGTAHGTLQGAASLTSGKVVLNGTAGTFVNLPGGLIAGYPAVTFEFWASFGANANWVRAFEMGRTNGTAGENNVYFCPHSGSGDYRLTIRDPAPTERVVTVGGNLDNRVNLHVVCTLDPATGFMGFYTNGVRAASRTDLQSLDGIATNLFWLGRSLYSADGWLNASIDEFRIYNAALAPQQAWRNFSNGPDFAPTPSVGAPPLRINPALDPGGLRLVWPEWAAGVGLWYATNLDPESIWWPVASNILVTNGQALLVQPTNERQCFFRLGNP